MQSQSFYGGFVSSVSTPNDEWELPGPAQSACTESLPSRLGGSHSSQQPNGNPISLQDACKESPTGYPCSSLPNRQDNAEPKFQSGSSVSASSSFYGNFVWQKPKAALPPIFAASGGRRPEEAIVLDRQLRASGSLRELMTAIREHLPKFDIGNVVIALSAGIKLIDDRTLPTLQSAYPAWNSLLDRVHTCVGSLEPRGLSMVAYAAAKLSWRDAQVLDALASASEKKSRSFGTTDIAKLCWAFAKLDYVEEASSFWKAMEHETTQKIHDAKYVDLSMIAWSFGNTELGGELMYAALARAALGIMDELTPQCLSNLAWAFARVGIEATELFTAISRRARTMIPEFADFDVTNLCWALAKADEVDFELLDELASHTVRSGFVKRFSAQMASQLAWAFAVTGFAHKPLFEDLADFVAKHASVFETQYVANCAWAYAALDVRDASAFNSLAHVCKGGRLWAFRQDEFCAICWAFAKVRWKDDELLKDMVQVASNRLSEFDNQSLINLLSSLVALCPKEGVDSMRIQTRDSSLEECAEEANGSLRELLDNVLGKILADSSQLRQDELAMAVRLFCSADRLADACSLCHSNALGTRAFAALLAETERQGDVVRAAQIWERLAMSTPAEMQGLRAACLQCAIMMLVRSGSFDQASELLGSLSQIGPPFDVAARSLLKRLNIDLTSHSSRPTDQTCNSCLVMEAAELRIQLERNRLAEIILRCGSIWNPAAVLQAVEEFCAGCELAEMAVGGRAAVLDETASKQPKLMLELGGGCGYATARIAARTHDNGGCVISVEEDPFCVAICRCLLEIAGLSSGGQCIIGKSEDVLPEVLKFKGSNAVDVLLLRGGGKACYLAELRKAEELRLLAPDCCVLADHILNPGSPQLLWQMHAMPGYSLDLVEIMDPGMAERKNWMAICTLDISLRGCQPRAPASPELASLVAESERLWQNRRLRGSDELSAVSSAATRFACRLRSLTNGLGLVPRRCVDQALSPLPTEIISQHSAMQVPTPLVEHRQEEHTRAAEHVDHLAPKEQCTNAQTPRSQTVDKLERTLQGLEGPAAKSPIAQQYIRTLDFKRWLSAVDPSGGALQYLSRVSERFDSVLQITTTYVVEGNCGQEFLSSKLFSDLGVHDEEQRSRFCRWFRDTCGIEESDGASSSRPMSLDRPPEEDSSPVAVPAALDFRTMKFTDWLASIDSTGGVQEYLKILEDSYDTVAQVIRTYIDVDSSDEAMKTIDPQLFDDLGIMTPRHQELFREWFVRYCGVQMDCHSDQGLPATASRACDSGEIVHELNGGKTALVANDGQISSAAKQQSATTAFDFDDLEVAESSGQVNADISSTHAPMQESQADKRSSENPAASHAGGSSFFDFDELDEAEEK